MANLKDTNVAAVAEKMFDVSSDKAWEFVAEVQAADRKEKEENKQDKGERREKEFMAVIVDPEGKFKTTTCFIVEKLPTLHGSTQGLEEEWGMEEFDSVIDNIVAEARTRYKKKGPFECLGDVLEFLPAKFLKEYGIKPVSKQPVCIMGSNPESLYNDDREKHDINDNVSYIN